MAYNKITSHFSSSQTFSNTNLFIYDSNTEELKTTQFYLEDESSSNTITASNNTLIITGTIDVQNDITASDIIFDGDNFDKGIRFGETDNYIRKVDGLMSIESPLGLDLDSNISVKNSIVKGGITGSYINTHSGKLLSAGDNIVVDEETLPSGKIRWKIAQGGGSKDNCGKTTFTFDPRNSDSQIQETHWKVLTGSDSDYINYGTSAVKVSNLRGGSTQNDSRFWNLQRPYANVFDSETRSSNNGFTYAYYRVELNLENFTTEHKNYIQNGNRHIFIIHADTHQPKNYNLYIGYVFSLEMPGINQEGCKYTFIFAENRIDGSGGHAPIRSRRRPLISVNYRRGVNFNSSTWGSGPDKFYRSSYSYPLSEYNGRTSRDLRGVSLTFSKIGGRWHLIGNE